MCDFIDMQTGRCDCEKGSSEGSRFARREEMSEFILEHPRHVEETIENAKFGDYVLGQRADTPLKIAMY